jgi:hypothetical protein
VAQLSTLGGTEAREGIKFIENKSKHFERTVVQLD